LDYQPREADLGSRHIVHGGLAITVLDEVMTWAAILAAGRVCVAAELTVRLKQPIRLGLQLRVEGWVAEADPRLRFCRPILRSL
jgi:acyl-CoA hydrolase